MQEEFVPDSIVQTISQRFIDRAKVGWKKYNTNLDRTDLTTTEWVQHLQEELHDAYVYSEKLKQDEIRRNRLLDLTLKYLLEQSNWSASEFLNHEALEEFTQLHDWYEQQKQTNDQTT